MLDERAAFKAWNNDVDCPLAGRDAKSAAWVAWNYRAMLQAGNLPVIPDGYVFAPIEPTSEMINAALKSHLIVFNPVETYSVMLAAAPESEGNNR